MLNTNKSKKHKKSANNVLSNSSRKIFTCNFLFPKIDQHFFPSSFNIIFKYEKKKIVWKHIFCSFQGKKRKNKQT